MTEIHVSDKAFAHLGKQLKKQPEYDCFLLVLRPDGCSGYQFDLKPITMHSVADCIKINNYLYIDSSTSDKFSGLRIDVEQKDIFGYKLIYSLPTAKDYCGCGKSFKIQDEKIENAK